MTQAAAHSAQGVVHAALDRAHRDVERGGDVGVRTVPHHREQHDAPVLG